MTWRKISGSSREKTWLIAARTRARATQPPVPAEVRVEELHCAAATPYCEREGRAEHVDGAGALLERAPRGGDAGHRARVSGGDPFPELGQDHHRFPEQAPASSGDARRRGRAPPSCARRRAPPALAAISLSKPPESPRMAWARTSCARAVGSDQVLAAPWTASIWWKYSATSRRSAGAAEAPRREKPEPTKARTPGRQARRRPGTTASGARCAGGDLHAAVTDVDGGRLPGRRCGSGRRSAAGRRAAGEEADRDEQADDQGDPGVDDRHRHPDARPRHFGFRMASIDAPVIG